MNIFGFKIERIKPKRQTCEGCPSWRYQKTEHRIWSDEKVAIGWCDRLGRITDLKSDPAC